MISLRSISRLLRTAAFRRASSQPPSATVSLLPPPPGKSTAGSCCTRTKNALPLPLEGKYGIIYTLHEKFHRGISKRVRNFLGAAGYPTDFFRYRRVLLQSTCSYETGQSASEIFLTPFKTTVRNLKISRVEGKMGNFLPPDRCPGPARGSSSGGQK